MSHVTSQEEDWKASLFGGLAPLLLKDILFVLSKFVVFDLIKTSIYLYFPEARDSLSSTLLVSLLRFFCVWEGAREVGGGGGVLCVCTYVGVYYIASVCAYVYVHIT